MSSSKTTDSNSTTAGTSNVVQTPTNAPYVDQGLSTLGTAATALAGQNPASFVAPADPLQTQAATLASGLTGNPGAYATANGVATDVAGAAAPSIAGNMTQFMDPYTQQVVNTTLQGFDQNAGYTRAADTLAKAGDTTFGGSGGAIQTALNEQNIANERAATQANLENTGFNTSLAGATSQAQLDEQQQAAKLAASQAITANATAGNNAGVTDAGTQASIGSILQQIAQTQAGAPINSLGSISSIFDNLPSSLDHGTTSDGSTSGTTNGTSTTTSSDPMGSLGSLLEAAGSIGFAPFTGGASLAGMGAIVSDRRVKTDIERVGKLDNGLAVFKYRYKAGGPMQIGVMAQDAAKTQPDAVKNIGGLLAVDYSKMKAA